MEYLPLYCLQENAYGLPIAFLKDVKVQNLNDKQRYPNDIQVTEACLYRFHLSFYPLFENSIEIVFPKDHT